MPLSPAEESATGNGIPAVCNALLTQPAKRTAIADSSLALVPDARSSASANVALLNQRSCFENRRSMRINYHQLALISLAGIIAGVLEISFIAYFAHATGETFRHMLQTIASGVLGYASYSMGRTSAAFGLVCHFGIVLAMATAFHAMASRYVALLRHPLASAVVYGAVLFFLMNFVVVPLSKAPATITKEGLDAARSLLSHIVFVAYPIVLLTNCAIGRSAATAIRGAATRSRAQGAERLGHVAVAADEWIAAPPKLVYRSYCDFGRWPEIFDCIFDAQFVGMRGNQMVLSILHMKSGLVENRLRAGPGFQAELEEEKDCYRASFRNQFIPQRDGTLYRVEALVRLRGLCRLALLLPPPLRTAVAARKVRRQLLLPMKTYAEKLARS